MGGLVSRYFMENKDLNGDAMVEHLVMAGTPNAGSPFGKIPGGVGFVTNIANMAVNFLPDLIPGAGLLLKGVRLLSGGLNKADTAAKTLTTLDQMNPKSEFIGDLNDPAASNPTAAYSIIAGDVGAYKEVAPASSGFSGFLERTTIWVGDIANSDDHDIAVSLDSIRNEEVWKARNQEYFIETIACHHLNYFTSEAGRTSLAGVFLGKKKAQQIGTTPDQVNPEPAEGTTTSDKEEEQTNQQSTGATTDQTNNQDQTTSETVEVTTSTKGQDQNQEQTVEPIVNITKSTEQIQVQVTVNIPSTSPSMSEDQVQVNVQVNIQTSETK